MTRVENVKFGVIADLHADIVQDAHRRMDRFLWECRREQVDFIVQLGDFVYPDEGNCDCRPENRPVNIQNAIDHPTPVDKQELRNRFESFEKPHYHVLGNHDLDFCSKEQMTAFLGMPAPQYAFEHGGVRFAVLDCNFWRQEGQLKDFCRGDYFDGQDLPYLSPRCMEWLEKDMWQHMDKPFVLFSHQRLVEGRWSIRNHEELRTLFRRYRAAGGRVALCMNGHNHMDDVCEQDGVCFFDVNSASNQWLGEEYACARFSDRTEQEYPNLRYTAPYADCLYAIVEMKNGRGTIHGRASRFVSPSPRELGCMEDYTAQITDHEFSY